MSNEKVSEEAPASPEIHFEPIVSLPKVDVKSLEENEEAILKLRAKLYRFETSGDENEWKERGVGEVKILKHGDKGTYRVLMRRDKTFKICANHYITREIELKTNCGSDRAWVWTAQDFADEEVKTETLAIRFANADNAKKFKEIIIKCQDEIPEDDDTTDEQESNKLAKELEGLKVKESNDEDDKENEPQNKDNETSSKGSEAKESEATETTATEEDKGEESTEDTPEK